MYNGIVNVSSEKLPGVLKTADTLQIKGLGEKFNEGVGHLMDHSSDRKRFSIKHDSKLLSVPSTQSGSGDYRQLSTESLPEYLHRSRDFSSRQHSYESPHQSFESFSGSLNLKLSSPPLPLPANSPPPPLPANSPPPKHLRKKFRRLSGCGSSSERGNSIEETDRSLGVNRGVSPAIPFTSSRQSSVSSEQDTSTTNNIVTSTGSTAIAKKKRELFSSARSSRSGESNKSSMSEHSKDTVENNRIKKASLSSSGQSLSQEEIISAKNWSLKNMHTKQSSNESLEEMKEEESASDLSSKFKKKRYLLKRQNRLEKSTTGDTSPSISSSTMEKQSDTGYISSSFDNIMKSSPSSPLNYNYPTSLTPPVSTHHNLTMNCLPPPPQMIPPQDNNPGCISPSSNTMFHPPISTNTKSLSCSSISSPIIECHSPSIPTLFTPSLSPPPPSSHFQQFQHQSIKLPHVRVTSDSDNMRMDARSALPPVPNMSLLYPAFEHERRLYKSRSFDHGALFHQHHQHNPNRPLFPTPTYPSSHSGAMPQTTMSSSSTSGINSHSTSNNPPSQPSNLLNPLSGGGGITTGGPSDQFGHCPKAREGPALGCNFCWNTTDINGRILRRKTKYHCPECQANLCIVPCFQSYHEALEKEDRQSQT
ncbi:uncharacterized protein [Lepeophtheirus salmonis]|nr:serine/arginine repetitive matrix protein 1-like isoform X2 [Lepeophtheirus salmonis]